MDIGSFVGYKYPTYVETEQYTWIGFSNPTFQSFPNFRNVWTSAFLSDTSIRPTSKPNNLCRSDSRIRHSNHSQIFAMCEHRFFLSDTSIRPTSKPRPRAGFAIQARISGKKQAGIWLGYHLYQQRHISNL